MGLHERWLLVAGLAVSLWVVLAAIARWVLSARIRGSDLDAAMLYRALQTYVRLVHPLSVRGFEHVPVGPHRTAPPGPLIIAANHTAGVDPLLIQSVVPYEIRWVMAQDMRVPAMERLWTYANIIFVDRQGRDSRGLREALRHLKNGGVIGIFPEGHIERPARRLLPFEEGVGLLIARSGAPVLPVVIEGTPEVDPAWASLVRASRPTLRFLPIWRPIPEDGQALGAALRERFRAATGWPLNDQRAIFRSGQWWYLLPDGRTVSAADVESRA